MMQDFVRYNTLPTEVTHRLTQLKAQATDQERASFYKSVLLVSILELLSAFDHEFVTQEVMHLYEDWFHRVIDDCERNEHSAYTQHDDKMLKDLALCTGNMFPAGAQIVEVAGPGKRTFLQGDQRAKAKGLLYLATTLKFQTAKFYQIHTDDRYLQEFTSEGFRKCYLYIADMLRLHPDILGVWSASWYFDPQVQHISPHLGHLYARPHQNGARFFDLGPSECALINATSTSRTRRSKVESGEYTPTGYAMIWRRQDLLRWVETQRKQDTTLPQAA
jgi:hypothetical protein